MIATILAFVTGLLIMPWIITLFVLAAIWSEYGELSAFSLFLFVIAGLGIYLNFGPSYQTLGWIALGYIPTGLVWSVFRYRRYVNKKVRVFNEAYPKDAKYVSEDIDYRKRRISGLETLEGRKLAQERLTVVTEPTENVERMLYWTLLFPVSIVESILHDVIDAVRYFITTTLRKVYNNMWKSALKNVEEVDNSSHV